MIRAKVPLRLVAVLAVAFTLCHRWGTALDEAKSTQKKKHGHRAKSLFRRGLESLMNILIHPTKKLDEATNFTLTSFQDRLDGSGVFTYETPIPIETTKWFVRFHVSRQAVN